MTTVFWFSRLKAGVEAAAYERWVQETDYRLAKDIACIRHYRVHRIVGPVDGDGPAPFDYVEVLDVTDINEYRAAMNGHPAIQQIVAEIGQFIDGAGSAWGEPIVPLGKERSMD